MFKDSISRFIQEVAQDNECIEIIVDFLESCQNYTSKASTLELASIIKRYNMEGNEYRKYILDLTNSRNKSYNALIANFKIINRLCDAKNIQPPISCNLEDSEEVDDIAIKLVEELFRTRKI